VISVLRVLSVAWLFAPITVALLGGSITSIVVTFVIGGVVVFGWMGLIVLVGP
jgi:hypothetical protein